MVSQISLIYMQQKTTVKWNNRQNKPFNFLLFYYKIKHVDSLTLFIRHFAFIFTITLMFICLRYYKLRSNEYDDDDVRVITSKGVSR